MRHQSCCSRIHDRRFKAGNPCADALDHAGNITSLCPWKFEREELPHDTRRPAWIDWIEAGSQIAKDNLICARLRLFYLVQLERCAVFLDAKCLPRELLYVSSG